MNKINSLYEFIKQKSKEKGRPLKIICDWDECLQPINPLIWYKFAKKKGWKIEKQLFEEWFTYYWKNARVEYKQNIPYTVYTTIKEIEEIRSRDPDWWSQEGIFDKNVRKPVFEIMNSRNYYEEAPYLSIARDLLLALTSEETIISKLIIIIASPGGPDSRKKKKFNKSFAKFPNTELILEKPKRFRERGELRWERIKQLHPDFDIFIDDSPTIINDSQKNLTLDKLFVIPNYKLNRPYIDKKDNIYLLKTTTSNLEDSEFSTYDNKQEREREREQNQLKTLNLRRSCGSWNVCAWNYSDCDLV